MRILACGDTALLVEVNALADVLGLTAALRADPPPGVVDIVSAARTVLLRCAAKVSDLAAIGDAVRAGRPRTNSTASQSRPRITKGWSTAASRARSRSSR